MSSKIHKRKKRDAIPIEPLGILRSGAMSAHISEKSRSSIYREADTPGTTLNAFKKIFPRKGQILRTAEHQYFRAPIWGGTDPAIVEKHYRQTMSRLKKSVASKKANASKIKLAEERALRAIELERQGITQQDIADALGLKSTRGVRKLLLRGKPKG